MTADGRAFLAGAGVATQVVTNIVQALQHPPTQSSPDDREFKRGYRAAMERCDVQLRISRRRLEEEEDFRQSLSDQNTKLRIEISDLKATLLKRQPISARVRMFLHYFVRKNGWKIARLPERRQINLAAMAALEFYKGLACDGAFIPLLAHRVLEQPTEFNDEERKFVTGASRSIALRQFLAGLPEAPEGNGLEYSMIERRFGQLSTAPPWLLQPRTSQSAVGEHAMAQRVLAIGLQCHLHNHVDELPLWRSGACRVAGAECVNATGVIWEGCIGGLERLRERLATSVAKNAAHIRNTALMPGGVVVPAAIKDRAGTYFEDVPFV